MGQRNVGEVLSVVLVVGGIVGLVSQPHIAKGTFVDEHALMVGRGVATFQHSAAVVRAVEGLHDTHEWTGFRRAVVDACEVLGLAVAECGPCLCATHAAPKSDGKEIVVIASAMRSSEADRVDTWGTAMALLFLQHHKRAVGHHKDVVVVVGEDAAALGSFAHWYVQGNGTGVSLQHELGVTGALRNAFVLDLALSPTGHLTFSQEGFNGAQPNMDLVMVASGSVTSSARRQAPHHLSIPFCARCDEVLKRWHVTQMVSSMLVLASGTPTGAHAHFIACGVDALTIASTGPSVDAAHVQPKHITQFVRGLEKMVRSIDNLGEKLHHSNNVYVLMDAHRFVPLAHLAACVGGPLIGLVLRFLALRAKSPPRDLGASFASACVVYGTCMVLYLVPFVLRSLALETPWNVWLAAAGAAIPCVGLLVCGGIMPRVPGSHSDLVPEHCVDWPTLHTFLTVPATAVFTSTAMLNISLAIAVVFPVAALFVLASPRHHVPAMLQPVWAVHWALVVVGVPCALCVGPRLVDGAGPATAMAMAWVWGHHAEQAHLLFPAVCFGALPLAIGAAAVMLVTTTPSTTKPKTD